MQRQRTHDRRGPGARAGRALGILLSLAAATASAAPGSDGSDAALEQAYRRAFDAETSGQFSALLESPDPARALASYETLLAAYHAIMDRLFESYSPDALRLPRWYAQKLTEIGFAELSRAGPEGVAFFRRQLYSSEFDRVVHAYFVLSHNAVSLRTPEGPSPVWSEMLEVARRDAQNRYWISLRLAESRLLGQDYRKWHTAEAFDNVTVRELVSENARELGVHIYRVLGLGPIRGDDPNVADLDIRYAKEAAADRVRTHQLLAGGKQAGYRRVRDELTELEEGDFRSPRLIEIMEEDLFLLLEAFGLSEDHAAILARLEALCAGRGGNRFKFQAPLNGVRRRYAEAVAASRPPEVEPAPPPSREQLLAMGPAAYGVVLAAFDDPDQTAFARQLVEEKTLAALIERAPPDEPEVLRRALLRAFEAWAYPTSARDGYLQALDALPRPESTTTAAARQRRHDLVAQLRAARTGEAFRESFDALRTAYNERTLPTGAPAPELVEAFAAASVRALESESVRLGEASARLRQAGARRRAASEAIETAEIEIVDANRRIRAANQALGAAEEAQAAAVAARNEAVTQLNRATREVGRTRREAQGADPDSPAASAYAEAQRRAAELERDLDASIREQEAAAHEAAAAADAAEEQAHSEQARAQRETASLHSAVDEEDAALRAEHAVEAELQKLQLATADVVNKLVLGLGLLGVRGAETDVGAAGASRDARLIGLALLVERAQREESLAEYAAALEREAASPDGTLAALARLALE